MFNKIIYTLVLFVASISQAQTSLSSLFKNHMVLQQKEKVNIWGNDKARTKIKITTSWGETESTKTDKNGKWKLKLQTPTAGGPYTLTINGSSQVKLQDVLIGEVWLCSGQSNMQMPVNGFNNQPVNGSQEEILNSKNNNIRVFTVKRNASLEPIETLSGDWKTASPKNTGNFSATAYFFGKKLEAILNVPIGLIVSSWGNSSAEAWTEYKTLKELKTINIPEKINKKTIQQTPRALYNGMIHPIVGYHIKGNIWYQGEANKNRASGYTDLMNAMIISWRKQWNQGDFPFYTTQIAPYNYPKGSNSAYLREAQLKTSQTLKNTGMAVTLDIGKCTSIHPPEKKLVGQRLAYWALAKDYLITGIEYSGPIYKNMKANNNHTLELTFSGTKYGINSFGKELSGFEIAGDDKIFYPATAKIIKKVNTLELVAKEVKKPVAARYNFKNCVEEASLFSTFGLPASWSVYL